MVFGLVGLFGSLLLIPWAVMVRSLELLGRGAGGCKFPCKYLSLARWGWMGDLGGY